MGEESYADTSEKCNDRYVLHVVPLEFLHAVLHPISTYVYGCIYCNGCNVVTERTNQ